MNYYNDIDKNASAWTQQLIKNKLIPDGIMDCKSITDVNADELKQYDQCHFFNGISGWAHALDLAGWPTNRPIWCASLPCQPFSCAGKQKGTEDERHLWPVFFELVKKCLPVIIVGEQVEAAVNHNWVDGVFSDLETQGYTCGFVVLGAHSVCSPHRRQRIYWVARRLADTNSGLLRTSDATGADSGSTATDAHPGPGQDGMANTSSVRFNELSQREFGGTQEEGRLQQPEGTCSTGCGAGQSNDVAYAKELRQPDGILGEQATTERKAPGRGTERYERCGWDDTAHGCRADSTLGDTNSAGCETFGNVASGTGQGPGKPESTGASGGRVEDSRCTTWSEDARSRGEDGQGAPVDHSRSSETGSMANTRHEQPQGHGDAKEGQQHGRGRQPRSEPASCCIQSVPVADTRRSSDERRSGLGQAHGTNGTSEGGTQQRERSGIDAGGSLSASDLANSELRRCEQRNSAERDVPVTDTNQSGGIVGNSHSEGLEGHRRHVNIDDTVGWEAAKRHSAQAGFWDGAVWHLCRDGKHRRIPLDAKPVLQCLVDGLPEGVDHVSLASLGFPLSGPIKNRTAILKGYGNAIVPQVAAAFIKAVMTLDDDSQG